MTAIAASGLHVTFGERPVLEDIDLSVAAGELVGLIGPNGAGKTTLIRAIVGLQRLAAGTVTIGGEAVAAIDRRSLARRLAYLAQSAEVHWPLTVERLVALGRLPHLGPFERPGDADADAIAEAMEAADVANLAGRRVTNLSGGERTRVLLARALAVEPEVLLADEPVASLDPLHQLDLMALLRRLADRGAVVMVVLHDLSLATRFCDRMILLHRGRVLGDGPPEAVMTPEMLERAYGVEALIGRRDGEFYVVPWRILGRRGAADAPPASEER